MLNSIELAETLPPVELMGMPAGVAHIDGYIIRQYADRVRIREKNGIARAQCNSNTR
jgi:hypothetical protein